MNAAFIQRALAALTAVGILGAAFELAAEQHWRSPQQLIPWAALVLLTAGVLLLLAGDAPRLLGTVRAIVAVVLLVSAFGVYAHVAANHTAGSMADPGLSGVAAWWSALTKTVGQAPPLAPGMLGQSALLLLLASFVTRRPAVAPRHHEVQVGAG